MWHAVALALLALCVSAVSLDGHFCGRSDNQVIKFRFDFSSRTSSSNITLWGFGEPYPSCVESFELGMQPINALPVSFPSTVAHPTTDCLALLFQELLWVTSFTVTWNAQSNQTVTIWAGDRSVMLQRC